MKRWTVTFTNDYLGIKIQVAGIEANDPYQATIRASLYIHPSMYEPFKATAEEIT